MKILKYFTEISKATENFTNYIHDLDKEGELDNLEREDFIKLVEATGYYSGNYEDKKRRTGFKNNLDILGLAEEAINTKVYIRWEKDKKLKL